MHAHRPGTHLILALLVPLAGCGSSTLETERLGTDGEPLSAPRIRPDLPDIGAAVAFCDERPVACTTACGSVGEERCQAGQLTGCQPPAEVCDNGVDDDCDGLADHGDSDCPPILLTCEDADGSTCNGDIGAGDKCDPMDNDLGCAQPRFTAWCNRTNPATPGIFEAYARSWVESRCDQTAVMTGATWGCTSLGNTRSECTVQ